MGSSSSAAADAWDDAARDTVRLPPHVFSILPPKVAAYFEKLGCTVPQPTPDPQLALRMMNAIRGQFARAGQTDYAIVCSIDGQSRIEVHWGGRATCPAIAESSTDRDYLQGIGDGAIGYSRSIWPAPQRKIGEYRRGLGGPRPPYRAHQGIEDYFEGKASSIFYCAHHRWHELQGMD